MTTTVKLIILGLIVSAFLGLSWTAKHYHAKYIAVTAELAAQKVTLDTALAAAKKCSEGTRAVTEATTKKEGEVVVAQKAAEVQNTKKQSNATTIIKSEPTIPTDLCKSSEDLFVQYKKNMAGK